MLQGGTTATDSEHDGIVIDTDLLGIHDFVGGAGVHDAVLMDAARMGEGICADDGFVRGDPDARKRRDEAARFGDLAGIDVVEHADDVVADGQRHDDFLERCVSGAFAEPVDRTFDLGRACLNGGDAVGGGKTEALWDNPAWDELSQTCLGCGTCTFVCPTCQCYDLKDYDTGNGIQKYRCWDSCMYSDFTMMAHGNNRTSQMQRYRQRFMHKLVYFPANNDGMYSCVGCGRCVDKCPAHLNIVKVIKAFQKEEAAK